MDVQRYLRVLASRKWIILLTAEITLLVVLLGTIRTAPTYTANALVRVATGVDASAGARDVAYAQRVMETYIHVLESRPILETAINRLDLSLSPGDMAGMVDVSIVPNTELIKIDVEGPDPQEVAAVANTLSGLLVEQGQSLYAGAGKSAREILQEQLAAVEQQLEQDRALLASYPTPAPGAAASADPARANLTAKIASEERTYATLLGEYEDARVAEAVRANSLSVVEPAVVPSQRSSPNLRTNLLLGSVVGLAGGLGLALLFENLDPVVRSPAAASGAAGIPVVGRIPRFRSRKWLRERLAVLRQGETESPVAEALRRLGTSVLALVRDKPQHTLVVTSAEPKAGKSTLVANLATAIAQTGRKVILVDADMRHPNLHLLLGTAPGPGLSEVLAQPEYLDTWLQETRIPGLKLLASGAVQANPAQILSVPTLRDVAERLAVQADIVLWDTPPVLATADAALLAPLSDGVLLVAAEDWTTTRGLERAAEELSRAGAVIAGLIYNGEKGHYDLYYYHQAYRRTAKTPELPKTPLPTRQSHEANVTKVQSNNSPTRTSKSQ